MGILKTFYHYFTKLEEIVVGTILVGMTVLVFASAVARSIGHPIVWATDFSTFLFAWEVFLGGDILIRKTGMGGVEIIATSLPPKTQKTLKIIWFVLIICFCAALVYYGSKLCLSNTKRVFQTMHFSYSWCTLAVPFGCFLMIISSIIKIKEIIQTPASFWVQRKRTR